MIKHFIYEVVMPMFVVMFLVMFLVFFTGFFYEAIQKNSMTGLGYDAKIAGLSCVAKYNGRWVYCSAILRNQVEVINK